MGKGNGQKSKRGPCCRPRRQDIAAQTAEAVPQSACLRRRISPADFSMHGSNTDGAFRTSRDVQFEFAMRIKADIRRPYFLGASSAATHRTCRAAAAR